MRRTFIKKEGVVITTLARYLLGEKCGNRLKTIDELANECRSSVGLTQAALGNDSNLLIVFYVQIMPDDFVMQLHRF